MFFYPQVSIIIPVYNGSNYLREAIDSALCQTYKNIEVIVVNDGSNDGGRTEEIAKSYGDKIRYFSKENGGVSSALNLGIRESEGEYISWLSHDDLYLPGKIEKQVQYLAKVQNEKTLLFSDYKALDLRTGSTTICRVAHEEFAKNYDILLLLFRAAIHGCTMLLPKQAFEAVGFFNEDLKTTQDYEMWFKFVKNGYKFVHVPDVLIETRWHENQGTISMSAIHNKEVEDLYTWAVDLFCDEFKSFSFGEITVFLATLKNILSPITKERILLSWRSDNLMRFLFSFFVSASGFGWHMYDFLKSLLGRYFVSQQHFLPSL